jgi:hypothetical protein
VEEISVKEDIMQDSILMTIRKLVCGDPYADHFDTDLLVHINACFSILNQLGVGPENGFVVTDETQSWSSYIADNHILNMVKTYITLKVRVIFDPPLTSSVLEAMNKEISQLEWRLNVAVDPAT